jgi:hypothetical protein
MISSSGMDSVPPDMATFLAAKALEEQLNQTGQIGPVVGSLQASGSVSGARYVLHLKQSKVPQGGTFSTILDMSTLPKSVRNPVMKDQYVLSPVRGKFRRQLHMVETLDQGYGAITPFALHDERIVMRSWGIRQLLQGQEGWSSWGDAFRCVVWQRLPRL